jgi:hypothetical protein
MSFIIPPIGFFGAAYTGPYAGTGPYATIKRPVTADQWSQLVGYAPFVSWEFQAASGNIPAVIGSPNTLTTNSTGQNYGQAVADWTTDWAGTDLGSAHGWVSSNNIVTLHNTSIFAFAYFCLTSGDGSVRSMFNLRSGDDLGVRSRSSNPGIQMVINSTAANTASSYLNATPTPHPICMIYDNSGPGLWRTQTDLQQGTQTYASFASANRTVGIGQMGAEQNAAGARYNYLAIWTGAAAEALADLGGVDGVGGKEFLRRLGWSPP